jgi:hypothetical protein
LKNSEWLDSEWLMKIFSSAAGSPSSQQVAHRHALPSMQKEGMMAIICLSKKKKKKEQASSVVFSWCLFET